MVLVSAEADGVVRRILAGMGDRVREGQVLVELDREKLQYNYDLQKAALASTLAKYGATDRDRLPPIEQTPDVQKAQAELVQARQAYDRTDELHKRQLVPMQTLDDAEAALRSKQASYDSALQNARNLQAVIDASDASVKLADRQLRDTSIRAPFDGYVQQRFVTLGQFVKGSTLTPAPVISVVRIDMLKAIAEIPERMAPWIEIGQPVEVHVDAFPDRTIMGKVSRISPAVNPQTRAFAFEARVPNAEGLLKPGTFARVHIETAKTDQVLTLPYGALQYRYGINRVFVVAGDRLEGHELKIGDRLGERVEVVSGVKPGDLVATTDVDVLADGMKVTAKHRME
jgi:RND family efflux transporter MFP subunit